MLNNFTFCIGITDSIKNQNWDVLEKFANLGFIIDEVFDSDPWLVKKFCEFVSIKIDEVNEAMKETFGE